LVHGVDADGGGGGVPGEESWDECAADAVVLWEEADGEASSSGVAWEELAFEDGGAVAFADVVHVVGGGVDHVAEAGDFA